MDSLYISETNVKQIVKGFSFSALFSQIRLYVSLFQKIFFCLQGVITQHAKDEKNDLLLMAIWRIRLNCSGILVHPNTMVQHPLLPFHILHRPSGIMYIHFQIKSLLFILLLLFLFLLQYIFVKIKLLIIFFINIYHVQFKKYIKKD